MGFKARHPALHRASIFPKQFGDLLAAVAASDQQQPVQPMVVPRLIEPSDFLLDSHAQTSASAIANALMTVPPYR